MTPAEALADAIEEIICVTRDEASDLVEALRARGFEIIRVNQPQD